LLDASCASMPSLPPRRRTPTSRPDFVGTCCLRPTDVGSASKAFQFRGHQCVRLRYGLTACCPRFRVAFGASFNRSVSLTIVALLRGSGFCPGGSVSHWTHLPFLDTHPDLEIATIRLLRWHGSQSSPDVDIHPRTWKWEVSKEIFEAIPIQARSLAAPRQPFIPRPFGMVDHPAQTPCVPIDAEILEVASNAPHEGGMLHRNRLVPMATAPVADVSHDPSAARLPRHADRDPSPTTAPPQIPGEAELMWSST
jgi:hypothetical protein